MRDKHTAQAWRRCGGAPAGFSLIELCIVMVIMSILSISVFRVLGGYLTGAHVERTNKSLTAIEQAVALYLDKNGHLPCPAPLNAKPGEAAYGFALDCAGISALPPDAAGGQYHIAQGRDEIPVIIGHIPARTLNIPDHAAWDGWGDYIQYAVTVPLTDNARYSQQRGAITVVDEHDMPVSTPAGNIQYALISSGGDHTGPGSAHCDTASLDGENCNGDAVFRASKRYEGSKHYNDIIRYAAWVAPATLTGAHCDVQAYMAEEYNIPETAIMDAIDDDMSLAYLQAGETLLVCNSALLERMGEKKCTAFMCDKDGALKKWKVL